MIRLTNADKFERDLKKAAEKFELGINSIIKNIAFRAYRGVAKKTPVDTGYARESWMINPDHPDPSVESASKFKGKKASKPTGKLSNLNLNKLRAAETDKEVERWFITNNVPYILYLEAGPGKDGKGGSKQSAHMVTRTLAEMESFLSTELKEFD